MGIRTVDAKIHAVLCDPDPRGLYLAVYPEYRKRPYPGVGDDWVRDDVPHYIRFGICAIGILSLAIIATRAEKKGEQGE